MSFMQMLVEDVDVGLDEIEDEDDVWTFLSKGVFRRREQLCKTLMIGRNQLSRFIQIDKFSKGSSSFLTFSRERIQSFSKTKHQNVIIPI